MARCIIGGIGEKDSMSQECVIVDVDGTLAEFNPNDVQDWVLGAKKDWVPFLEFMADARPIAEIKRLVEILKTSGQTIIICSGRPDKYKGYTVAWLEKNNIPFDAVYLRAESDDLIADEVVKQKLLDQMHEDGLKPWLVLDDRSDVVNFWREAGLCCLQCAPGDF